MLKIRTISRTDEDFVRKTTKDINKLHRNRDPSLHPFDRAREYAKALVATKMDKMFAKPFLYALDGHSDSVNCMSTIRNRNVPLISGSCDGELKVWDLSTQENVWSVIGHKGFVRGVAPDASGYTFFSCGDDKLIKQWSLLNKSSDPISVTSSPHSLTSIDHHWIDSQFATSGEFVSVWDHNRTTAVHNYKWGSNSMISVRFNPAEACLLASTGNDRSVCLYDLRSSLPMKKFVMAMNSNRLAWNPMEPFNFVLANEDNNLYSFDMRNLSQSLLVHKDHVSAVMDIAFSPTGREFVSGSYDRTIRIFKTNSGRSREAYFTKRMQKVFCVNYSSDSKFVISGSDDTNIRVWKNNASESLGLDAGREERKKNYLNSLKKRFSHMPEVKKIANDKKLPKNIKKS